MPSLYNESTGMIETLSERYEREYSEMIQRGCIEEPSLEFLDGYLEDYDVLHEGDSDDLSS